MHAHPRRLLSLVVLAALMLLAAGCSPEAKKKVHLRNAERHYAAGDYDRAEVEYLNLLKLDPQNGHAIGQLGQIYTAQGRTGRAIAYIMKGHELLPNDLDLRLKVGQLYYASGKLAEARTEANFILDRRPLDPEAPSLFAATMANPDEAETLRQRLLGLPAPAPAGAPVLTALASLELRLGRQAEAESLLQQAKAKDATFAGLYSVLASLHLMKKDLTGADEAFRQAALLSPPRSPRHIQYAQFKLRSGDSASATKLLEEITTKTPDYMPAWISLAEINLMQNKLEECESLINRALGRDAQNLEALILQGKLHNLRNESDKAIALLEKLVATYPRIPTIHLELGRAYASIGDLNKAINSLSQAVALAPNAPEAAMLLARVYSRKGDHNTAVALLRRIVEQRPDLPQARMILADTYRSQGNLADALAIYQSLESQNRDNPQIPMLAGLVLAQQRKQAEARIAFERSFALSPNSPVALEQLVNLDLQEKKFQQAVSRIETEVAKNPKLEGFGQLLLAKIFLAQEDRNQAEPRLKKAIELMPESPTAYFLLAGIYTRTNRQEEALGQLAEVLTRNPTQTAALMLTSVIHDQRGNYAAARDGYEKLLQQNPRSIVALNNLAYLQSERFNNLERAHELAQKARQLAPGDPHSADTLGWILYRKRQYTWAISHLQEAAEKLPAEAEIHYHLGLTQYMLGDEQPARVTLERSLELGATAAWAATARQALSILAINPAGINASARPALDKALADRPDDPVALSRLAALQEREGQSDLAVASLETALKTNAQNVNLLLSLARLHDARKNSAKALDYAKAARKQAPDDPAVAYSLGRLAYDNGDYPWAASLLQEAARRGQESPDLLYSLALANYSVGRVADALAALRNALSLADRQTLSVFAHAAEARQMIELIGLVESPGEAARNSALVERTLEKDPASVPGLMAAAAISEQRMDSAAARQAYEKILSLFPDFTPARYRLVILGASLKAYDQKIHDSALQLRPSYPNDPLLAKTLGIQGYLKGDHSRAAALLKESLATRNNDAETLLYLGLAQHRLKDAGFTQSLQRAIDLGLKDESFLTEARKILAESK